MFGLSSGYTQALRLNCNLILDFQSLPNRLERFKLDPRISVVNVSKEKSLVIPGSTPNHLIPVSQKIKNSFRVRLKLLQQKFLTNKFSQDSQLISDNVFKEKSSHEFSESINQIKAETTMVGYFQSWKYFNRSEVLPLFDLNQKSDLREKYNIPPVFTTLHIRVYSEPYREFHGLLSKNYYLSAIEELRRNKRLFPIIVFTDNRDGASDILSAIGEDLHSILSPTEVSDQVENMEIMKLGGSFIGANSSYSWWAAYLGNYEPEDCIFPQPWYRGSVQTDRDLYFPGWKTIAGDVYKEQNQTPLNH